MKGLRSLLLLVVGPLVLLHASVLWAAGLRTEVSARQVGVGQPFTVQITAVQGDGEPEPQNPRLTVKGKATVHGPSLTSQKRVMMRNFSFESESSVVATYTVVPTEVGKIVVGPGTFEQGGRTLSGETIVVEVLKEATPNRRGPAGRDPFRDDPFFNSPFGRDPFSDLPPDLFGGRGRGQQLPEAPEEYLPRDAPSDVAFLHAFLSKSRIVLGEPVRLTIVAFGARGDFRELSPNGPSLGDFLSHAVIESSHDEPAYSAVLGGREYIARKIKEYILVPLTTGELTVGEMSAVLRGTRGGYPASGSPHGTLVKTPPLTVSVTPTPESGKPDRYFPGDVGRYVLEASVTPDSITQGDYVEVTVVITGQGQVPSQVLLPEAQGLVWGKPVMKGEPTVKDGVLQGSRVLKFPLEITKVGSVPLGEVLLHYYDQRAARYKTAKAELGTVEVKASQAAEEKRVSDERKLTQREKLFSEEPRNPSAWVRESRGSFPLSYWALLLAVPLLLWLAFPALDLVAHARQRLAKASDKDATSSLKQAQKAAASGEHQQALKWTERALHDAVTQASGVKARGLLRSELPSSLTKAGLDDALTQEVLHLFDALESARYGGDDKAHGSLARDAEPVIRKLKKVKKVKSHSEGRA